MAACPGGCSTCSWGEREASGPDDSVEALAGDWKVHSVRRSDEGCLEQGAGSESAGGVLRIRPVENKDAGRADPGGAGDTPNADADAGVRLRVLFCATERCSEIRRRATLRPAESIGWTRARGTASILEQPRFARRCRLQGVRYRLEPAGEGVRLERIERAETVTLEGGERCSAEFAIDYAGQLSCRAELQVRAR